MSTTTKLSDLFGSMVFNEDTMKERLSSASYEAWKKCVTDGTSLDISTANEIAQAMKQWAVEKGATHYTHWFQPMTGVTAEKHDSFIAPVGGGKIMMEFSGKELIRGEPDASSFPSGGLRATFEARGYTAWDPTSFAFIKEGSLCIPTVFCSYSGEALDKKTPLLRSMDEISRQAVRILRLFGDTTTKRVVVQVGPEQEYFLVDKAQYAQREDLRMCGRTLFGAKPPKGQELDDHYYGVIRERVGAFMKELNEELWKLGVAAKTQHNEVAPAQHELAAIYTKANLAVDHNQIVMETMKKVASRRGLACLLHEKPFQGVNGSGKHNNWSLTSDTGINMLEPGVTPHENIQFLLVLACIMKAVDVHADLLRQSAAVPGNDYRLGAQEAPPAIISIFVGEQIEDVIDQLCSTGSATHSKMGGTLRTGVTTLPDFDKDATDRNRTSPFAFTNNKFEFRMVGSSDSISSANVVLNTIVAEAFKEAADILEASDDFPTAVHDLIKKLLSEHRRIIFNGNGYTEEWVQEAERRGLPNLKCMVDSIPSLVTEKAVKLFGDFGVYTRSELYARAEIEYETYTKSVLVEARTMSDMAGKQIIPAVIRYSGDLARSLNEVRTACPEADMSVQTELVLEVSSLLAAMKNAMEEIRKDLEKAGTMSNMKERAHFCYDEMVPAMNRLREPADRLEMIVDKEYWPFPSYGDMIFEV